MVPAHLRPLPLALRGVGGAAEVHGDRHASLPLRRAAPGRACAPHLRGDSQPARRRLLGWRDDPRLVSHAIVGRISAASSAVYCPLAEYASLFRPTKPNSRIRRSALSAAGNLIHRRNASVAFPSATRVLYCFGATLQGAFT